MTGPALERSCSGRGPVLGSDAVRGARARGESGTARAGDENRDVASWPPPARPVRGLGLLLGCATALLGFLHLVLVGAALGPLLLWPLTRGGALRLLMAGVRVLTALERRRRSAFFGDRFPEHYKASDQKLLRYLAVRCCTGLLTLVVLGLLGFGAILAGLVAVRTVQGAFAWDDWLAQLLLGGVLLFLDLQGLHSLAGLDERSARECFGLSERELLQRRIDELATSRAAVVHAVDAERRRIERDLHDGMQQRLVALAMVLGRVRRGRDPGRAEALLRQAHQEAQDIVTELREVAWRIYPSALDSLGLREALGGVAERSAVPVRTEFEVAEPLPQPVETAAYFVVSESVTNAAKHSGATSVRVALRTAGGAPGGPGKVLVVRVRDDGKGGADPAGSGLSGLRGRVAALDGALRIDSPPGGPTTITAELPCVY
ncbi:sensor histidine kinase [Streptomyces sp. DW4-2]|uniref:histidine kinase n=1 Tax=Streptomyces spirodelae TaxID=2812904 RepID=A0ABS3WVB5_9ACTN|nr:sensor histidine kinase [Streptomyces spirodelae]